MEKAVINMLYKTGAHYFIQKPNSFSLIKQVIYKAISNLAKNHTTQPLKEHFVLSPKPDAKENEYN